MSPRAAGARAAGARAASVRRPLQLYLLRHADAGDPAGWTKPDAERPLSAKGRRQASWVGRWLRRQGRLPNPVITSPKVRAAQTAELACDGWPNAPIVDERLSGGATIEVIAAILAEHAPRRDRVMIVGHDPDFSEIASALTGASTAMKKGAVARIDVSGTLAAGAGVLRWLVPAEAVAED